MTDVIPLLPPLQHLPEAVQALRHERERVFVWHYMLNGANGADAARKAGYSDKKEGAKVRAHELLHRDDIQQALRELSTRYLFSLAPKALFRLSTLLESESEPVALKAVAMTLSRTGFAERTGLDVTVDGQVKVVDHTTAAVADLRRLKGLGVPRAELERVFGFTGLSRYEKLLAAEDAKLIEAQATEVEP